MNEKGFTLIELLSVILIIGILATTATISISMALNNAKEKQLSIIKNTISSALDNYRIYNSIGTTVNLSALTNADIKENYLDPIKYDSEKCIIDENAGYVKIVEREAFTDELGRYVKEEYCVYFVCNGKILINDVNDLSYCE